MKKNLDESPKRPRSHRIRDWWFRGVEAGDQQETASFEVIPSPEVSSTVRDHLAGMADHARDIENAAHKDGARIRQGALAAGDRVTGHVQHLESQLAQVESEFAKVIAATRAELADLRTKLGREAEAAQAIANGQATSVAAPTPPASTPASSPAPSVAAVPANGNGTPVVV